MIPVRTMCIRALSPSPTVCKGQGYTTCVQVYMYIYVMVHVHDMYMYTCTCTCIWLTGRKSVLL